MDEDDDFFDMRSRFKLPEKRQKRPLGEGDESNSDSSGSDDSDSEMNIPTRLQPRHSIFKIALNSSLVGKAAAPSKKKSKVISLDSDFDSDSEEETPQITPVAERKRPHSLTPPPVLGPVALQQARQVLADHMNHKRTQNRTHPTSSPGLAEDDASSEFNDDFDMAAYESKLKSDIAQQATRLKQREQASKEQQKIMLVLKGRSDGDSSLPEGWEKPLGMNVFSTITLSRLRDQFKDKRTCEGEVILAWRGVQLRHGTPKDIGLTHQTQIDVYTAKSWKFYEDQRKRSEQRAQRKEDVVSLSSEDEVKPPPAKVISITLQGPGQKVKLRVAETATIRTLAGVYREKLKIPSNRIITIALDGDPLMESATVKNLDVDDGDVLDVQIDNA